MIKNLTTTIRKAFQQVKNLKEFEGATQKNTTYILNFHAAWCGPCKTMSPLLINKQKESQGKWKLIRVDVDEQGNAEICQKYSLAGVPTIIFVKNGKQVNKAVGAINETKLSQLISQIV